MTDDVAADTQPTAAFDPYERLTLVWRRGLENGRGQLWYRTYSLSVPLDKAPLVEDPDPAMAITDLDNGDADLTPAVVVGPDELRDGLLHFPAELAGRRILVEYEYILDGGTARVQEYTYIPGMGPERAMPMDGLGSESMPALAVESFLLNYPLDGEDLSILSSRHWLAWISTRDLYEQAATPGDPPVRGRSGTHVYYGTFLPDYSPRAEAR